IRYGTMTAVDALSLTIAQGEVFGFVGPNGAGKTSTIRSLFDLQRPAAGTVEVLGEPAETGGPALRARCGYLPGDLALFPYLTGAETLDFFARLYRRPPARRDAVLGRLGFNTAALGRKVSTYSTGMRQQIGIACAFQHDPELLILDEPTSGLDPLVREAFLGLVRDAAIAGRTVLLSSHVLAEIEDCAHRIGLIHRGSLRQTGTIAELRDRLPKTVILRWKDGRVETRDHTGPPADLLRALDPVREELLDLEIRPADLRDVFRDAVDGDPGHDGPAS
ncbi:MAG: ABC transporter ATP-binding protein, partial [Planctomycetota bacterium]